MKPIGKAWNKNILYIASIHILNIRSIHVLNSCSTHWRLNKQRVEARQISISSVLLINRK